MLTEILLLVGLLLLWLLMKSSRKPSNMPPGSFGLPIIGQIPPSNISVTEHFGNLKKTYGNIFTTKWGSRAIVVLADYSLIKRALNNPDLQGRPDYFSFDILSMSTNAGVIKSLGKLWSDNRRFMLHHLRDMGMGKTVLENSIQDEAKMLVDYLEEHNLDKPAELDWSINVSVVNVIWQMMASKRYDASDPEVIAYNKMTDEDLCVIQGPIFLLDMMPWLGNILPSFVVNKVFRAGVLKKNVTNFNADCLKIILEHKATLDADNPRDIIDYYLIEVEATKEDQDSFFSEDYKNLLVIIRDMFIAGSETTSTTLRWMILFMAINPEIQEKAHKALDVVVAKDQLPSLGDRPRLPYIDALLLEVMRMSSLVPTSLPHVATTHVKLEGYSIPQGTTVLPCLELCHRDPKLWKHPNDLYPEHFLDENGKLDSKQEGFVPFSLGRRQCLGESLARMELFLFSSAILQRFTIEPPPGIVLNTNTDLTKKLLRSPLPFKVVLKKRK